MKKKVSNKGINTKENISIYKEEKKGIRTLMLLYLISWGILMFGNPIFSLISWVVLGLIGLSMWKIMEKLAERGTPDK